MPLYGIFHVENSHFILTAILLSDNVRPIFQQTGDKNVKFKKFGYPDRFIKHGKTEEIEDIFGLTEKNIVEYVEKCNEKVVDRVNALVIQ